LARPFMEPAPRFLWLPPVSARFERGFREDHRRRFSSIHPSL